MHIFAVYYFGAALVCAALAFLAPFLLLSILFIWSALSLAAVGAGYSFNIGRIFRKRENGSIPLYSRWLFIPVLFGSQLFNVLARARDSVPPIQKIDEHLFLGCRLTPLDIEAIKTQKITAVLDVTAEFDALDWTLTGAHIDYLNIPILDQASPSSGQLTRAVNWIHGHTSQGHNVLVHCALGRGRSVLILAAYLLTQPNDRDLQQALNRINAIRHTAKLNKRQFKTLARMYKNQEFKLRKTVWLVVNPVAGSGVWAQKKDLIESQLAPYFTISINTTTAKRDAAEIVTECIAAGADFIVACGGDGTVTSAASALVDTNIVLAIIPLGTANALAKVFGISGLNDALINNACAAIINGYTRRIDTASVNNKPLLLLAAIGFEQKMVEYAEDKKQELGQLAYVQGMWQALIGNSLMSMRLQLDNGAEQLIETASLVIANIAPASSVLAQGNGEPDPEDGQLDVTWLDSHNVATHAISLAELCLNQLTDSDTQQYLSQHRLAKTIEIDVEAADSYVIDGEIYHDLPLTIKTKPKSLTLIVAQPISTT